ncbi:hypothetical protein [Saccharothrix sp.]|uniref:hypothetical protein n=1 Tax=Saccharothrix sp. TaxID=1873460 RepID=UPI00281269EB|nr:hypothetical protein [Saccharothrix sp.]
MVHVRGGGGRRRHGDHPDAVRARGPGSGEQGSYLADLTGVREDKSPYVPFVRALDARGNVVYEG